MDTPDAENKEKTDEGQEKGETLWEVISALGDIESVLGATQPEKVHEKENTVRLPLSTVIKIFPEEYVVKEEVENIKPEETIMIVIPDLLEQLASGRITVSVADMAFFVPTNLLVPSAFKDHDTRVSLPLAEVVSAINAETLKNKIPSKTKQYDAVYALKDPFAELFQQQSVTTAPTVSDVQGSQKTPSEPAVQSTEKILAIQESKPIEESVVEKKEEKIEEVVVAPVLPEPVQQVSQPQPEISVPPITEHRPVVKAPPAEELTECEHLAGVDINSATIEQFMTLAGVGRELAERIVTYRTEHGPFKSIFDLCNVPKLSRRIFALMTGMPYSEKRYHRRNKLASLLKISFAEAGNLKVIVEKISQGWGIAGCVIADKDGFILAESNCGPEAEKLGAMVPRIVKQIHDSIILWKPVEVDAVSISVSGELLTLLSCNVVNVCVVHKTPHISRAQLMFLIKVGKELSWLLSYRAYISRY